MEEFTLEDFNGDPHSYKLTLHSPRSGGLKIVKDLAPILVAMGKEGSDITEAVSGIEGLIDRMVSLTHRDGKPLRDPAIFDEAFKGNYQELYKLLAKIVESNRFLGALSSSLSGALAE